MTMTNHCQPLLTIILDHYQSTINLLPLSNMNPGWMMIPECYTDGPTPGWWFNWRDPLPSASGASRLGRPGVILGFSEASHCAIHKQRKELEKKSIILAVYWWEPVHWQSFDLQEQLVYCTFSRQPIYVGPLFWQRLLSSIAAPPLLYSGARTLFVVALAEKFHARPVAIEHQLLIVVVGHRRWVPRNEKNKKNGLIGSTAHWWLDQLYSTDFTDGLEQNGRIHW